MASVDVIRHQVLTQEVSIVHSCSSDIDIVWNGLAVRELIVINVRLWSWSATEPKGVTSHAPPCQLEAHKLRQKPDHHRPRPFRYPRPIQIFPYIFSHLSSLHFTVTTYPGTSFICSIFARRLRHPEPLNALSRRDTNRLGP